MNQPIVHAVDVRKRFGANEVLKGVSLEVDAGQVVCLIGASGSGKSTFLRCINHLEDIDSGLIEVAGVPIGYRRVGDVLHDLPEAKVARQRREVGMVFQRFNLFANLTALGNVTAGPIRVLGLPKSEAVARATALLGEVGLGDKLDAYPTNSPAARSSGWPSRALWRCSLG